MDNTGDTLKNIFVDFDGTLIFENSSRVFEKVLFDQSNGVTRFLLHIIFFSKVSPFTNLVLESLSFLFFNGKDLRLLCFLNLFREIIHRDSDFLINRTITYLNINPELNAEVQKGEITILSRGIYEIITRFLEKNDLLFTEVISSRLSKNQAANLLIFRDKLLFFRNMIEFCYYTDDKKEKDFLVRNICIKKVEEKILSKKKIFVIYYGEN